LLERVELTLGAQYEKGNKKLTVTLHGAIVSARQHFHYMRMISQRTCFRNKYVIVVAFSINFHDQWSTNCNARTNCALRGSQCCSRITAAIKLAGKEQILLFFIQGRFERCGFHRTTFLWRPSVPQGNIFIQGPGNTTIS